MCQRNLLKTMTLGHKWTKAQETASVKHTNTPTPPLSGHGLESCPRGGREGTLSQVGWKLLPLWGGRRGLEEVRALARKISGQRERGQGQNQKQGPRQHQENQGQPGKDRGQA